ncbi:hypothetical protein ACIRO1_45255 [Streptomyces sp. NPDC102381]|jgi:hypothetical protein|uniref:hypothetical protein n=1 Tax=Streptomyces sp. NPDC102381 TaxID=3366164 RepID=UPI00380BE87C
MSETASTPNTDKQQQAAAVLPVLTALDQQASALEKDEQITQNKVVAYELAAQHAQHLISKGGLSADDIKTAAEEHGGAPARNTAERALDHASHPRSFEPIEPENEPEPDNDIDEEVEISL